MTDLKSKTVEELRDLIIYGLRSTGVPRIHAFDELARRLEEVQQKIVAQRIRITDLLSIIDDSDDSIAPDLDGDDLSDIAAHDEEVKDELNSWADIDFLEAKIAEYRAKAGRKE